MNWSSFEDHFMILLKVLRRLNLSILGRVNGSVAPNRLPNVNRWLRNLNIGLHYCHIKLTVLNSKPNNFYRPMVEVQCPSPVDQRKIVISSTRAPSRRPQNSIRRLQHDSYSLRYVRPTNKNSEPTFLFVDISYIHIRIRPLKPVKSRFSLSSWTRQITSIHSFSCRRPCLRNLLWLMLSEVLSIFSISSVCSLFGSCIQVSLFM